MNRSFGSRAWSIVLTVTGVFYGLFGAAHLGVSLDWVLLIGALLVLLAVFDAFEHMVILD